MKMLAKYKKKKKNTKTSTILDENENVIINILTI